MQKQLSQSKARPCGGFAQTPKRIAAALLIAAFSAAPLSEAALKAAPAAGEPQAQQTWVELGPRFERLGLGIKGQKRRDTCAVFTLTGALEYALSMREGRGVQLSEEYLNWAANEKLGDDVDGATFAELVAGFDKWGACDQRLMPYQTAFSSYLRPSPRAIESARSVWEEEFKWHWLARNAQAGLTRSNLAAAKRVLRRGWPVAAGGEHCVLLTGFADDPSQPGGGVFQTRNYANRKAEIVTYADTLTRFESMLWVELPAAEDDEN